MVLVKIVKAITNLAIDGQVEMQLATTYNSVWHHRILQNRKRKIRQNEKH